MLKGSQTRDQTLIRGITSAEKSLHRRRCHRAAADLRGSGAQGCRKVVEMASEYRLPLLGFVENQ